MYNIYNYDRRVLKRFESRRKFYENSHDCAIGRARGWFKTLAIAPEAPQIDQCIRNKPGNEELPLPMEEIRTWNGGQLA
ncbi:hypothetical protein K0M31_002443 [Melipona bicolor]|uniref:Uncharacterized protein n=1 Tax=Melipona bicolor TaxID=60889 RepID=A0AA40GHK1_9HYME|nr:hypothetical protein K0M31_002443 [Melipona bicolor]